MELEREEKSRVVLIVEDEPDNREIMRTVVEEILGLRAVLASDGETALQMARREQPVIILMDLMMPILDGFEAISSLKKDPETASIPVIAVSALNRATDRQRALDLGADGYLSKPFDLDHLTSTLTNHIETEANTSKS